MSIETASSTHPLDMEVRRLGAALTDRGVKAPEALLWLATGEGQLPDALANHLEVPLGELDAPAPWSDCTLHVGRLSELSVWLIEDLSGEPDASVGTAPWIHGLPAWLAARAGASLALHTTAGSALTSTTEMGKLEVRAPVGGFGLVRDHINLSGLTPLLGLGSSRLGPLFPDVTALHHLGLRRRAMARAEELGIVTAEVIAACTTGPALETPAERRLYGGAGADVAIQSLQWPLLACAHAGLGLLSIVAISDANDGPADVPSLVEAAGVQARTLEDFILSLVPDLSEAVEKP
ncbi:MAG: purine nucleoside phosphorylase [Planctomycetota bacterium]|jgi:purine nucleoside phosphorylase